MSQKTSRIALPFFVVAVLLYGHAAMAEDATAATGALTPAPTPDSDGFGSNIGAYFANWFERSDAAKASQPHWMTPLVTVTPRLEQEFRYDQFWEHAGNSADIDQFDSGKGLELIPTNTNEVLLNLPAYENRSIKSPAQGWEDWQFLVIKQRLLSANEQNGNYIVSAFVGVQAPFGAPAFTNNAWIVTPTIAGGKGWGDFNVQSTLSVAIPMSHGGTIGNAVTWNTAFMYNFAKVFWPEFETNLTHWYGGLRGDKTQLFLTPGLILGRFQLYQRATFTIGLGYQVAVTPKLVTEPALTPMYNHAWIMSARVGF